MIALPESLKAYRVVELVTLTSNGAPVGWPMLPSIEHGVIAFSTGYVYPSKAINAKRNPNVAVLFSDPTGSGRPDADPLTLVQGTARVFDQDLQRNTERYVDQLLAAAQDNPLPRLLRIGLARNLFVGYLCRIWIEVSPERLFTWERTGSPAGELQATRPASFTPGPAFLPAEVGSWLARYTRPPVLSFVTADGRPAVTRVSATHRGDTIEIGGGIPAEVGAPACLTYHRLAGNYRANDSFIIRGHLRSTTEFVPEKVVGFIGSQDDRGVGSLKLMRMMYRWRGQLRRKLVTAGQPMVIVRPTRPM